MTGGAAFPFGQCARECTRTPSAGCKCVSHSRAVNVALQQRGGAAFDRPGRVRVRGGVGVGVGGGEGGARAHGHARVQQEEPAHQPENFGDVLVIRAGNIIKWKGGGGGILWFYCCFISQQKRAI